jgi:hypothetical protein
LIRKRRAKRPARRFVSIDRKLKKSGAARKLMLLCASAGTSGIATYIKGTIDGNADPRKVQSSRVSGTT